MTPQLLSRAITTKQLCRGRGMVNCKKQFAAVQCRHNHASESCKPMGTFFAGQFCPTPWTRTWKFISRTTVVLVIQYPALPPSKKKSARAVFRVDLPRILERLTEICDVAVHFGGPQDLGTPEKRPEKMLKNTFIQILQ